MSSDGVAGPRYRFDPSWNPDAGYGELATDWAHHGIAVTRAGGVVTMAAGRPDVVVFAVDGRLLARWEAPVVAGHGLTIVRERDEDVLWLADNGITAPAGPDGRYASLRRPHGQYGSAVKLTLGGDELLRVTTPPLAEYAFGNFAPTDVAVDERRHGGSGDIWLADGYGMHLVHRYDEYGNYLATISGEGGMGHFDQPHALFIDRRRGAPELYVADRGNARIQVFDLHGEFRRGVGVGHLVSPGGFAVTGTSLFVSELDARITVLGPDDEVVATLGDVGPAVRDRPGWPNQLDTNGHPVRPRLPEGEFTSPHGIAADAAGNLYLTEWLIGGRLVKLERLD